MSSPLETLPTAPAEPPVRDNANRYAAICTAVLTFNSFLIAMTTSPGRFLTPVYQDWSTWLPISQFIAMAAIVYFCGWPKTRRGKLAFAGMNVFLLVIAGLHFFSVLEYACIRSLQVLLRAGILGCWAFVVLGAPYIVYRIWRRSRGDRRPLTVSKWWFACFMLLLAAEPVAAVIKANRERLQLPDLPVAASTDEFHIAAIGESSMLGWPYVTRDDGRGIFDPRFGIPAVYAWRLQQIYPEKKIVMHNLAVQGLNLKEALSQLKRLERRPDLLLLYAGHNEFYYDVEELSTISKPLLFWLDSRLDASPTFYLLNNELAARSAVRELKVGSGRIFADHPIANRLVYQHRVERFRGQLEQLARYCDANGIAMQWIVPACGESVYEPDRSVVVEGTTPAEVQRLEQRYHEARALEEAKNWEQAAAIYREELTRQPTFAEFHFRLADCLAQQGQYDEARKHYLLARDTDGCPTRANSDFCRQEAEVADACHIPHFDAAELLRPETPHGIIDRSMVHDNVHPTLKAFFLIGTAAADQIKQSGRLEPKLGTPREAAPATMADALKAQHFTVTDLVNAYQHTSDDLRWLSRLRFDDTRRVREADEYLSRLKQLESGEIKPGENGTEALE